MHSEKELEFKSEDVFLSTRRDRHIKGIGVKVGNNGRRKGGVPPRTDWRTSYRRA